MRIKRTTTIVPQASKAIKVPAEDFEMDGEIDALNEISDSVGGGQNVLDSVRDGAKLRWSQGYSFFINTPLPCGGYVQIDYEPIKE